MDEEGLELSKKYLYGCLFNKYYKIEFINDDRAYYEINLNEFRQYNENEYNIIKEKVHKRLEFIYKKNTIFKRKQIKFSEKEGKKSKKTRRGGNPYLKKMEELFLLPPKNNDYNDFYKILTQKDRGYLSSTRFENDVRAVLLCFFHINDFDISVNSPEFIYNPSSKYRIISEQKNIKEDILKETSDKINENTKIYPVYADIEYTFNSETKELERQYFLSDGNHRIRTLKENNYNGMVPVIVCDYLESSFLYDDNSEKTSIKGGSKKIKITYNNFNYIRTIRLDKNKKPYVLINKKHIYLKN